MIRNIIFTVLICFVSSASFCQNRALVDSLKMVIKSIDEYDSSRAKILSQLMQITTNPTDAIAYADSLVWLKNGIEDSLLIKAYTAKGVAYRMKGELETALQNLLKGAELALEGEFYHLLAQAYLEIGTTYSSNADLKNALIYENKAIIIFRKLERKQELAINLLNTGYTYYSLNQYDTALLYYNESGFLFDAIGLTIGQAYTLGNRALVYWKTGQTNDAERDLIIAINKLIPLGDYFGMADYHNQLGNLYLEQGKINKAIEHLQKGLTMALEMDLKEQIRDASLLLSQLYSSDEDHAKSYQFLLQSVTYKDSIQNKENTNKMADLRTKFEVNLREKEIDLLEKEKKLQWVYIAISIILLLFIFTLYLFNRQRLITHKLTAKVQKEGYTKEVESLLQQQEKKVLESRILGREKERKYIARELHNHLGSLIATIKMNLNGLEYKDSRITKLHELVDQTYTDVRELSHTLNMGVSKDFGLDSAIQELVNNISTQGNMKVEYQATIGENQIEFEYEIIVYRIIQELISNILKHAKATKMSILLTYFEEDELLNVMVSDNGRGFKIKETSSNGMGISSLKEMVVKLDGDFNIDSHPMKGTTITINVPIPTNLIEI
jgi:two-component system NarL family sensor kinase